MRPALLGLAMACFSFTFPLEALAQNVAVADTRVFPESLTSTSAGAIIFGSLGKGGIYRAAPGQMTATLWITPETSGMTNVLGVLADDRSGTLYACSFDGNKSAPDVADRLSALKSFDLKTGALKASYPMPGGRAAVCNDIAMARDGTAYMTDMQGGRVLRLPRGGEALSIWFEDEHLKGADGIAIDTDGKIYVTNFRQHKLQRIDTDAAGKPKSVTDLTLSRPVAKPDGMRAIGNHRFLLAEAGGHVDVVRIAGDNAVIDTLLSRETSFNGVTRTRGLWWAMDGRVSYRSHPELKDKDPGPFVAEPIKPTQ